MNTDTDAVMSIKRWAKTLLFFWRINWFLAKWTKRSIILVFHRVAEPTDGLLAHRTRCVDPGVFSHELLYLQGLGYTFVALNDLVGRLETEKLGMTAVVTIDDGFKDLYVNAFPLLKKAGIPFTLFLTVETVNSRELNWLHKIYVSIDGISPEDREPIIRQHLGGLREEGSLDGLLDKALGNNTKARLQAVASLLSRESGLTPEDEEYLRSHLYLSMDELREMVQDGLRIENHSYHHWPLTALSPTEMHEEIRLAQDYISHIFHRAPRFFSPPFGIFVEESAHSIAEYGFLGVCTMKEGLVSPSTKREELPRVCPPNDLIDFTYVLTHLFLRELKAKLTDYIIGFRQRH